MCRKRHSQLQLWAVHTSMPWHLTLGKAAAPGCAEAAQRVEPPLTWGKPSFSLKNHRKADNSKEPLLISDKNNSLIKIFFLRIEGNILAPCVTRISQDSPLTLFSQNPFPPWQCTKTMASCIDGFSLIISLHFFVSLAPSVVSCLRVKFPALGCGHWGCSQQELQALERYE